MACSLNALECTELLAWNLSHGSLLYSNATGHLVYHHDFTVDDAVKLISIYLNSGT